MKKLKNKESLHIHKKCVISTFFCSMLINNHKYNNACSYNAEFDSQVTGVFSYIFLKYMYVQSILIYFIIHVWFITPLASLHNNASTNTFSRCFDWLFVKMSEWHDLAALAIWGHNGETGIHSWKRIANEYNILCNIHYFTAISSIPPFCKKSSYFLAKYFISHTAKFYIGIILSHSLIFHFFFLISLTYLFFFNLSHLCFFMIYNIFDVFHNNLIDSK